MKRLCFGFRITAEVSLPKNEGNVTNKSRSVSGRLSDRLLFLDLIHLNRPLYSLVDESLHYITIDLMIMHNLLLVAEGHY